jgi:hypothetical protein
VEKKDYKMGIWTRQSFSSGEDDEEDEEYKYTYRPADGEEDEEIEPVVDATFGMTICRDGSVGLRQPARFNRILLNMEEGVVCTETDQMRMTWRTLGDIIQVREKMEQEVARERAIEREQEQDMEDEAEARGVKRPFSQVD